MFDSASCMYGLKYAGTSICANLTETERHQFIVGTVSVRECNEIHLLEFDEDDDDVTPRARIRKIDGVWGVDI